MASSSTTVQQTDVSTKWGWFVALGIGLILLGGVAFGNLFLTTVATVYYVGMLMLIAGVVEIFHAFTVKTWKGFFFWLLSGILYAAAGVVTFMNPILAAGILTILLSAALIGSGLFRIWMGFHAKPTAGWVWLVLGGLLTAIVGIMIAVQLPAMSLVVIGMFLAIDLVFQGWAFIAFGLAAKNR